MDRKLKILSEINFEEKLGIERLNDKLSNFYKIVNNTISFSEDVVKKTEEIPEITLITLILIGELNIPIDKKIVEEYLMSFSFMKIMPRTNFQKLMLVLVKTKFFNISFKFIVENEILKLFLGDIMVILMPSYVKRDHKDYIENFYYLDFSPEVLLAVFFRRFNYKTIRESIRNLKFSSDLEEKLILSLRQVDNIYFINSMFELKKYIARHGLNNYKYFDSIAKVERLILNKDEHKTEARLHMLKEVDNLKEPYTVDHLKITAQDILDNNITQNKIEAQQMLNDLVFVVIKYPRKNTLKNLLVEANKLKRNPLRKYINRVLWRK